MKKETVRLHEFDESSSTAGFAPLPTAPLEIQNCDDLPSSMRIVRDPPPYSPPLPPHSEYAEPLRAEYTEPFLTRTSRNENQKRQRMRQCNNTSSMLKVALFEGLITAFMLAGGIWCLYDSTEYCPYYSAIWTSALFAINALVGMIAAKRCTVNFFVTHLILSLISLMLCAISGTISARNWFLIGTYRHPKIDRNEALCLIGEYDASRARYILTEMNRYDFKHCLFQLKLGIGINSVQVVIAIIEAILNFISSILCCQQLCTKCFGV